MKSVKNFSINHNSSLIKAMKQMSKIGTRCLIVVDKNDKYLGTLTDGDLRKSILKKSSLNIKINKIYNKNSTYFYKDDLNIKKIKKLFISSKFDLIPVLSKYKKIIKVIEIDELLRESKLTNERKIKNIPLLIMSGGKGTRLDPFSKILPKPLIPIKNKPIIEHIIEKFNQSGINNIYLTLNYKENIIKSYFNETKKTSNIKFISEKLFLGTAGSISLLPNLKNKHLFVTNCDILVDANYNDMLDFHIKNKYDITIITFTKKIKIDYGIFEVDEQGQFTNINEKPSLNYLINSGLYLLKKDIIKLIPKNTFFNMNDLIKKAKLKNYKIGLYPIHESNWIDVGEWKEYSKAIKKMQ